MRRLAVLLMTLCALALLLAALAFFLARRSPALEPELRAWDMLFQVRGRLPVRSDFVLVAGDEKSARDEHEQAEPEAAPQHPVLEAAERAEAVGNGADAPRRCPFAHLPPFAGMTRIRFDGCDLSRVVHGTPVPRV